jgi:hypothetical protein
METTACRVSDICSYRPEKHFQKTSILRAPKEKKNVSSTPIHFGVPSTSFRNQSATELQDLLSSGNTLLGLFRQSSCLVVVDLLSEPTPRQRSGQAYFHALLLGQELEQQKQKQVVPGSRCRRERLPLRRL